MKKNRQPQTTSAAAMREMMVIVGVLLVEMR